ncbi:gamma-tubulin complex component 6 [Euwallacea similis]|uniref:gamma-tubulin complex component 6 n=1 Tax=Euwallacea similis TaxID=1736056 RepID=UPI00344CF199
MEESNSIYSLITSLCESFHLRSTKLRKARSNCYELLLGKVQARDPKKLQDIEGVKDPILNLLAWCYKINKDYGFTECAQELENTTDRLKSLYGDDIQSFNRILTFLLCLKNIPKNTHKKLDLSSLPDIEDEMTKFNNIFKFPQINEVLKKPNDIFQISCQPIISTSFPLNSKTSIGQISTLCNTLKDEYHSSPNKDNIWDVVSHMKVSKRRSWESYGCGPPDMERPFLSELGELSSLWVENLESLYLANNITPSFTIINNKLKSGKMFVKDLKYLLVGMPTETFNLGVQEEFFICPDIMVEGITQDAIQRYCSSFLIAGTCYRVLNEMATPNPHTRKYKYPGFVFAGFCESLSRYLQYYRTAVISIPDKTNFLTVQEKTQHLQVQLTTIASICKVGPFSSENEHIPHGVGLLNYLYQKVLGLCDRNLCMVLYSILYPCCQIYLSRFLQQWLIQGVLNDPHGEFFIISNLKYLATRGRTYWSRSYGIREDVIPDFLVDLKDDILFCGKIMNLLKVCSPNNKLCLYLMGKDPLVLSCCLTNDSLIELEQRSSRYYLKASEECGLKLKFKANTEVSREENSAYLYLIAKKRAVTLRRIELERQKAAQEHRDKKLAEFLELKEQFEAALEQKQLNVYKDIKREIKTIEDDLRIEQLREKLIEEEASKMIDYYAKLSQLAELRNKKINKHIKTVNTINIETAPIYETMGSKHEFIQDKINSSSESFYSAPDENSLSPQSDEEYESLRSDEKSRETLNILSSESMDLLNANYKLNQNEDLEQTGSKLTAKEDTSNSTQQEQNFNSIQQAVENFEFARRIKHKVLNQELGITTADLFEKHKVKETIPTTHLTEAQRNKLKVLSSEFGINVMRDEIKTEGVLTAAQMNKNKVMGHAACFSANYGEGDKELDNERFVNKNLKRTIGSVEHGDSKPSMKKSTSLQLDFTKNNLKSDSDKGIPMSVDSTPMSDLPQIVTPMSDFPRSATPSSMITSIETKIDSSTTPGEGLHFDDIFSFSGTSRTSTTSSYYHKLQEYRSMPNFSKRVSMEEAQGISKNSLKLFLHESVSIPVLTQLKLANNEILKYFINELHYLKHLDSLRDYFFLQDGEFARNITESLFEKLYSVNFPLDLINCRSLQSLVFSALDNSSKFQDNSNHLTFKINTLPKCFDLGDPDVLDCLSLAYKVQWPLNILLPSEAISKYDQVFKFLIKLNRISWVLKKIFLEFKILAKETGQKEIYLMASPQYKRLHQCRHVMSHFTQTLLNYIVGGVLQPSWAEFEKSLSCVTNLDQLYNAHTVYIKDIIFRCMLNQKSIVLRNLIHKIFVVILKFYDYLRSRCWKCEKGAYVHPNFNKLEKIFKNFEELVVYFFKLVRKVSRSGYQPRLAHFLDVLDVNDYYSNKLDNSMLTSGEGG